MSVLLLLFSGGSPIVESPAYLSSGLFFIAETDALFVETGATVEKDPIAVQARGVDWTDWLAEMSSGEYITGSAWFITGKETVPALAFADDEVVTGKKKTQLRISGGTLKKKYKVTNRITTNSGLVEERSFFVKVVDK